MTTARSPTCGRANPDARALMAAAVAPTIELEATVLSHMWQVYESPARFKVVAGGRRSAKTGTALRCAMAGHGPVDPITGIHKRPGVFEGAQIAWLAPDYKQADAVWRKEIRPRLSGVPGVTIHKSDRIVEVPAVGGLLEIRTNENIDSLRGNKYHGVVPDEAAYLDFEYAWNDVISKCLIDYAGWLFVPSTTNAGPDGNDTRRIPSYFNLIVAALTGNTIYDDTGVELPKVNPSEWAYFHFRTRDNPILPADEIEREYNQYPPDSPVRQQELDALLIRAHAGRAFPEFDTTVHVVPTRKWNPDNWDYYAGLDWGYRQGAFQVWGVDPDGNIELCWEYYDDFRNLHAREAAERIFRAGRINMPLPEMIFHDDQMTQDTGVAGGMRLIDEWAQGMARVFPDPNRMPMMRASAKQGRDRMTYRQLKKNVMHRYLAYRDIRDPDTGHLEPWAMPKLRVQAHCKGFIREMLSLPLAPHDATDVDTDAPDHAYDCACFVLVARPEPPGEPVRKRTYDEFSIEELEDRKRNRGGRPRQTGSIEDVSPLMPDDDGPVEGLGFTGFRMPDAHEFIEIE